MPRTRDDFRRSVAAKLRDRVGGRCSNPDCRHPTTAGTVEGDAVSSIGIAAHITAAAPRGPRYDGSLTAAKRRAFDNGIWLCSPCSTKVDRDEKTFTLTTLKAWKTQAEAAARAEVGRDLPRRGDAVDTVAAIFSGATPTFIAGAIENVHAASSRALEKIDPRFSVTSSHDGRTTKFEVRAKQDVPFSLVVKPEEGNGTAKAIYENLATGEDVEVPMQSVTFDGSALLDRAASAGGTLRIESEKIPLTMKLWLHSPDGAKWQFDDLRGELGCGFKSASFKGSACGELVALSWTAPIDAKLGPITFDLKVRLERWVGCDVRKLPYWDSVHEFVRRLAAGHSMSVKVYRDGVVALSGTTDAPQASKSVRGALGLLNHAAAAKVVATLADVVVPFALGKDIAAADHRRLIELAGQIESPRVLRAADLVGSPKIQVELNSSAEAFRERLGVGTTRNFQIVEGEGETVRAFGTEVALPPRTTTFECVEPRLIVNGAGAAEGDGAEVELVFNSGSSMRTEYAKSGGRGSSRT